MNNFITQLRKGVGYILAGLRAIILFTCLSGYVIILIVGSLFFDGEKLKSNLKKSWCKLAVQVLGIHIKLNGQDADTISTKTTKSFLAVANHRSFIDPVIIISELDLYPLAKAPVAHYPLIGYAARKVGVIFVERQNKTSRKHAIIAIKNYLKKGKNILVFPEGTTSDQSTTLQFKKGAFIAAAETDRSVIPLTIHYENSYAHWTEGSMMKQYFNHFSHLTTTVYLHIGSVKPLTKNENAIRELRDSINKTIIETKESIDL